MYTGKQKNHDSLHCDFHFIAMVWNPTRSEACLITIGRGGNTLQHGALNGGLVDARKKKNPPFLWKGQAAKIWEQTETIIYEIWTFYQLIWRTM